MPHYEDEETIPVDLAKLWSFLDRHTTPEISRIHTEILAQDIVSASAQETVMKRTIDMRGKQVHSTWKITVARPTMTKWEILEGDGPWAPGSWLENTYTEVNGQVKVRSVGELKVVGVPFFLQKKVLHMVLDHVSEQDHSFLKAPP